MKSKCTDNSYEFITGISFLMYYVLDISVKERWKEMFTKPNIYI